MKATHEILKCSHCGRSHDGSSSSCLECGWEFELYGHSSDHVPDAGKMATETDQVIEMAREYYTNVGNSGELTPSKLSKLMAYFAIEYAREKKREAFKFGMMSVCDHPLKDEWIDKEFEDYLNRKA